MKKIIAILLTLASLAALATPMSAAECQHNYLRTPTEATCIEKAHMNYLCRKCGYSYKVYDDEYTAPENFWILAESVREGSTLTVTFKLFNNPGLTAASPRIGYNQSTLKVREFINGDVWSDDTYFSDIKLQNNPFTVFTEMPEGSNYNNGLYFTVVFDIIDPEGSYGITCNISSGTFPGWDSTTNSLVNNVPTYISLIGKSELGDHSYTSSVTPPTCTLPGYTTHTCSYCNDSYRDSETDPAGHSPVFSSVIKEPDFDEEGIAEYVCTDCFETSRVAIPVLEHYQKGDINGDTKLNAVDINLIRRIMVGMLPTLQELDAADIDGDGVVNAKDSFCLKVMVSGS